MPRIPSSLTTVPLALSIAFVLFTPMPLRAMAQEATPETACPMTSEEENEAIARRWHDDAISGHDLAVLDEIAADDIVHHAGSFPDGEGVEAVKQVLGALLTGFPDVRQTIDAIASDDDIVVTRWTTEGTHEGEFQGYAPTGLPITWSGINLFRIECGRIAEAWSELDGLGRAAQFEANAEEAP